MPQQMEDVDNQDVNEKPSFPDQISLASPSIKKKITSNPSLLRFTKSLIKYLQHLWLKYITCGTNEVCYWRHKGCRIGEGCSFHGCHLGSEPWLIEIGDHVVLARGVSCITHDGSSRVFRHLLPEASVHGNRYGTIRIHDNSFIGVNAIILPDIEIGPNSIVGAGSVVTRDVPPNTVVGGAPARHICSLEELIEKYKNRMIPTEAESQAELREKLTRNLWGEIR
jgi:acetyltransferase-like isoleucine patch superfamily enzyme